MNWKYIKPLKNESALANYEHLVDYKLPPSFLKCIRQNNGGRPARSLFDTEFAKERAMKSLLSFNQEDRETVWKIVEWDKEELRNRFVPFAIDNFGNLICFDKLNDNIVFLEHETLRQEKVADSFDDFLNNLYS